jgi:hypothetical protein
MPTRKEKAKKAWRKLLLPRERTPPPCPKSKRSLIKRSASELTRRVPQEEADEGEQPRLVGLGCNGPSIVDAAMIEIRRLLLNATTRRLCAKRFRA